MLDRALSADTTLSQRHRLVDWMFLASADNACRSLAQFPSGTSSGYVSGPNVLAESLLPGDQQLWHQASSAVRRSDAVLLL